MGKGNRRYFLSVNCANIAQMVAPLTKMSFVELAFFITVVNGVNS